MARNSRSSAVTRKDISVDAQKELTQKIGCDGQAAIVLPITIYFDLLAFWPD